MSSITTNKSLLLKRRSSFALFTDIVGAVRSHRGLNYAAAALIDHAWRAWLARQPEVCNAASALVSALDVSSELHTIAEYYKSLSEPGRTADPEANRAALIRTANECGEEHLPRIVLLVGNSYHHQKNYSEALRYYTEAGKIAATEDTLSRAQSVMNIAVLESDCGDSAGALRGFEGIYPIVGSLCHWYPALYAKYLNNLAALLAENGRIEESRHAIKLALASPFAPRFPEWRETQREIEKTARQPLQTARSLRTSRAARPLAARETASRPLLFFLAVTVKIDSAVTRLHLSPDGVASLLERYVKTARIRDRPRS